jgi:cbb3-type cytochrome oxidase maturation protein
MTIILFLILCSLCLALCALAGFIWGVRSGQFDDTCTPAMRLLAEEDNSEVSTKQSNTNTTLP